MHLARREPSNRFPYGYYRAETFASLIVSVFILVIGGVVLRESTLQLLYPVSILEPLRVVAVAAFSIPILYLLHRYVWSVGVEIHSQSLQSQAEDFKADIYASLLVFIAVMAFHWGFSWLEGVVGVMISLLIFKTGLSLVWETLLVLMDAVVKPERLEVVKKLVEEVRGVISVHRARIRQSGPFCFVDVSIGVDKRVPVEQTHRLTEGIEKRIKDEFPFVESISVHVEPHEETLERVAVPVLEDKGMDSQTTPHFGEAPYFLFVDIEEGESQKWMTKPNPGRGLEKKRDITTGHLLVKEEITVLLTRQLGEGPFHYLRDWFIEIYGIPKCFCF